MVSTDTWGVGRSGGGKAGYLTSGLAWPMGPEVGKAVVAPWPRGYAGVGAIAGTVGGWVSYWIAGRRSGIQLPVQQPLALQHHINPMKVKIMTRYKAPPLRWSTR